MKVHRWETIKRKSKLSPARIAEIEKQAKQELAAEMAEIVEADLRAIREIAGKTQVETAELLKTTQSELSRLERRDDYRLSTLRHYVEALGGELEIIAHIGNKTVRLKAV